MDQTNLKNIIGLFGCIEIVAATILVTSIVVLFWRGLWAGIVRGDEMPMVFSFSLSVFSAMVIIIQLLMTQVK